MNIVAFGASSSSTSINQKLASYAANQIVGANVMILDLNDFEMPIYSIDKENDNGIPALSKQFRTHLENADGIIISFAEHNGSYSAAFKNVMDWNSRQEGKIWLNKTMFLMATSPGKRGGQTVLGQAITSFPHQGGNVVSTFSLPSFNQNFSEEKGILDETLRSDFREQVQKFKMALE